MMRIRQILMMLVLVVAPAVVACGGKKGGDTLANENSSGTEPGGKSLYDRLGGKDAIAGVVDKFLANVVADNRINAMFANADPANLKTKLVDQICEATGGPCKYTGKTMKDAHAGMKITEADFNALVEDLVKALEGVPEKEQTELLSALAAMKPDIVTVK
jgi:hemoglobin